MAKLTQDDIQPVMDLLDLLRDVRTATADTTSADLDDCQEMKLNVADEENRAVAFLDGIPPAVMVAGLRAMEKEVQALLQARDIQVVELS